MKGNETMKHEGKFDALYAALVKGQRQEAGGKPP